MLSSILTVIAIALATIWTVSIVVFVITYRRTKQ